MDFETKYALLVRMVEHHSKTMPPDLPESARIVWMMQPVRDVLKALDELSQGGSDEEVPDA